ncbi:glycoside hydrolase family 2 TIM barrel-domain containing protein [Prolixibacter denitrificans]|uniref:Beta-galactosidase n=1 Tax=Prolixibacter denitrificans TaxID=1541063 RepID=A0A2P8C9H6_9BACT|nr:glycoside hydrolase family 2 TIM barrel-domain containing protein [Prolixibacter denitrificans]PSK81619.1 beta-galactosidase [Prolixibacter denitrificans]GET21145.1 hypothetical protein JCM18694_13910 [Prolixibacter denitrificans]
MSRRLLGLAFSLFLSASIWAAPVIKTSLNSGWFFQQTDHPDSTKWEPVNVPHTWNAKDAFDDQPGYYRGTGWYRRNLYVDAGWKGQKLFLDFEGVNKTATVFINEQKVGEHKGGYTAFSFDISPYVHYGSDNDLRVEVSNAPDPQIPPLEADFTFYGGIYRDVWLKVDNPIHFAFSKYATPAVYVNTPQVSAESAQVKVRGTVRNETGKTNRLLVRSEIFSPEGKLVEVLNKVFTVRRNSDRDFEMVSKPLNKPQLWSPDAPNLYTVKTTVQLYHSDSILDGVESPLGFRWFKADPNLGFFLNGKPLKLHGLNRHQDFAGLGNALPNDLHKKDFELIKKMGANFVRLAHYPQAPEVYRECDRLGLLVWSEIPVVNEITESKEFTENCLNMQREQIHQTYNHPSVVMYGYMNEVFIRLAYAKQLSDSVRNWKIKNTLKLARELDSLTRSEAPGRLTVMALHQNPIYNKTGIADIPQVIGWNLYMGWYGGKYTDLGTFLDKQHAEHPNRCIMLSEYGPGSDVRLHTDHPEVWDYSEEYQFLSHASYRFQVDERPYVMGMAAWIFADFGSEGRADAIPHINQKGLVKYNRTPKDVYHYYQVMNDKLPRVAIAGTNYTNRTYVADENGKSKHQVWMFTNSGQVTLYRNGEWINSQKPVDGIVKMQVPFVSGPNKLLAVTDMAEDSLVVNVKMIPRKLTAGEFHTIRVNVGSNCNFHNELTGENWIPDQPYQPGSFGYVGGDIYHSVSWKALSTQSNIKGTDDDPLYQTMREGLESYRFDVPDGCYKVTLLFAEPNSKAGQPQLIYNLSNEENEQKANLRSFGISMNGEHEVGHFNLARDYGALRAVKKTFMVNVKKGEGLSVQFLPEHGKTLLSGIRIEKR